MNLYEGLKLKQIKPYQLNNTYSFNMVGMEFKVKEIGLNTIKLYSNGVELEIQDEIIEEYFEEVSLQLSKQDIQDMINCILAIEDIATSGLDYPKINNYDWVNRLNKIKRKLEKC